MSGIFSIAPHAPFLETLADRVLDGTLLGGWRGEGAFWLSDVTIFLPTRRARLKLAEIFAMRRGGATLLPDIRVLGAEPDEAEAPFLPPAGAPPLPPSAGRIERRLTLAQLVAAFAERGEGFASPPNAAEILWLADSLGELVDDLIIEGVAPDKLDNLVPEDLAANWQDILQFLRIALVAWPAMLDERGRIDAAAARNERLRRQAASAAVTYGDRPVIAAGSTGSIPATAALLGAVAGLPRGALVLPGFDASMAPERHKLLLETANTQGHAQYGLARLLRDIGAGVGDVDELGGGHTRTTLVRAALSLPDETAAWAEDRATIALDDALKGVSILAAPTLDLEARAIAIAVRQAASESKSVGIVVRDQNLARRIAAELRRHGIEVDDPAGTPLFQSATGRLARQIVTLAESNYGAVDVIALLSNAAVHLGMERREIRRLAGTLDRRMRCKRPFPGLAGLHAITDAEDGHALLNRLGEAMAPVMRLMEQTQLTPQALVEALISAINAATDGEDLPGLAELEAWAKAVSEAGSSGLSFPPRDLAGVLAALMAGEKVAVGERRRDDIFIWGELEARLMNQDLMIVAGLNEDIWPAPADPGPWLSRSMRVALGLSPPERQQGQAAHDFEMLAGNAEVVFAFAERIGTAPALPSRLLQRLEAFIGDSAAKRLRTRGDRWLDLARAVEEAGVPRPATRPSPRPPSDKRPRRLSITEIEPLMRSPYDIYARHVLRLERMEPLGAEPDARERGTMIHKVFERFVKEGHGFETDDAARAMVRMAEEEFAGLEAISERRDIWLRRFERAATHFLEFERERDPEIATRYAERKGEWLFPHLQNFVLAGKADRLDLRRDGHFEILDFKTGGVPPSKEMTAFDAPQLLLEAAMARAGAFNDVPAHESVLLAYIKIGLGPQAFRVMPFRLRNGMALDQAVDEIERRMQGHVEAFLIRDSLAMTARIRPRDAQGRKPRPGTYDHLARTDEWTLTAGVDDPA